MRDVERKLPRDLRIRVVGRQGPSPQWIEQWVDMFVAWRGLLQEYSHTANDEGWCWSERASVGFMAAAAWRVGGVALLEYGVDKQGRDDRRRRYRGAGDLWLNLAGRTFALEAKHKEVRLDTGRASAIMAACFDHAGWDSLRNTEDVHHRVGMAFLPLLAPDEDKRRLSAWRKAHLEPEVEPTLEVGFHRCMRVDLFPAWDHDATNDDGLRYVGTTVLVGIDDL